jgi:hypothetical protein
MKSGRRGRPISAAEVTNVSRHGFWLLLDGRELFVSFAVFPWFREASIGQLVDVTRPSTGHLYWPRLDVDLADESIDHPERYPLVSRVASRPAGPRRTVTAAVRERAPAFRSGGRR